MGVKHENRLHDCKSLVITVVIYGDGLHTPWLAVLLVRLADTCYDAHLGTLLEHPIPGWLPAWESPWPTDQALEPESRKTITDQPADGCWQEQLNTMYSCICGTTAILLVLQSSTTTVLAASTIVHSIVFNLLNRISVQYYGTFKISIYTGVYSISYWELKLN